MIKIIDVLSVIMRNPFLKNKDFRFHSIEKNIILFGIMFTI